MVMEAKYIASRGVRFYNNSRLQVLSQQIISVNNQLLTIETTGIKLNKSTILIIIL